MLETRPPGRFTYEIRHGMSMQELHIRRALESEAAQLSALVLRAKAHWGYTSAQLDAWRQDLEVSPLTMRLQATFVGELDGRLIGLYSLIPAHASWHLDNLWIEPAHVRQGHGSKLLAHAIRTAADGGAVTLSVDADPHAAEFYLSCGGAPSGVLPAPIMGNIERVRPQFLFRCVAHES